MLSLFPRCSARIFFACALRSRTVLPIKKPRQIARVHSGLKETRNSMCLILDLYIGPAECTDVSSEASVTRAVFLIREATCTDKVNFRLRES
jgi:hypothetical protein